MNAGARGGASFLGCWLWLILVGTAACGETERDDSNDSSACRSQGAVGGFESNAGAPDGAGEGGRSAANAGETSTGGAGALPGVGGLGGGEGPSSGGRDTAGGAGGSPGCNAGASSSTPVAPCFEPCGGDPTGVWVLEDGCLSNARLGSECPSGSIGGSLLGPDGRLEISEKGSITWRGSESWILRASVPPACLGVSSVDDCAAAQLFFEDPPVLFPSSKAWLPQCVPDSCGSCVCSGSVDYQFRGGFWNREEGVMELSTLPTPTAVPYCVQGDMLLIGGDLPNGETKTSYQFRKRSCSRTPTPCAERTPLECLMGGGCRAGRCIAEGGNIPSCALAEAELHCSVLDGCIWDPETCSGSPSASCDFETCEIVPGCTWGPPVARCTDEEEVSCGDPPNCVPGCWVSNCAGREDDGPICQTLFPELCELAPGCTLDDGLCTGMTNCVVQTDERVCELLPFCSPRPQCRGTPLGPSCSELSVADCHSVAGCVIEW